MCRPFRRIDGSLDGTRWLKPIGEVALARTGSRSSVLGGEIVAPAWFAPGCRPVKATNAPSRTAPGHAVTDT